jgi:hypothetical protein
MVGPVCDEDMDRDAVPSSSVVLGSSRVTKGCPPVMSLWLTVKTVTLHVSQRTAFLSSNSWLTYSTLCTASLINTQPRPLSVYREEITGIIVILCAA